MHKNMSKKKIIIYLIIVVVIIIAFGIYKIKNNSDEIKLKCPSGQHVYFSYCSCDYICVDKIPERESGCSIENCEKYGR